jgi:nitrile hydratase subunit beta
MNGIHDMGGMDGFGPIERETDEPVFHTPWEARMFGLSHAASYPSDFNTDRFRNLIERMPPAAYLAQSYYERWWFMCAMAFLQGGEATLAELVAGHARSDVPRREDAMLPEDVGPTIARGSNYRREIATPPRFAAGQAILARNIHPTGHTRLPRYARGRRGVIRALYGAYVFPDSNAQGVGESPQHLYSVAFAARELWGPDAGAADKIHLDLWESYLEPA